MVLLSEKSLTKYINPDFTVSVVVFCLVFVCLPALTDLCSLTHSSCFGAALW